MGFVQSARIWLSLRWHRLSSRLHHGGGAKAHRQDGDGEAGSRAHEDGLMQVSSWKNALALAKPFFTERQTRGKAWGLTAILVFLVSLESSIFLYYSTVQKNFMTALERKEEDGFYGGMKKTLYLILVFLPIVGLHEYTSGDLKLSWRKQMVHRLGHGYLAGSSISNCSPFYRLLQTGELDNPDQRICHDVVDFINILYGLVEDITSTVMQTLGFISVLYAISPRVCVGVVFYALAGTLISVWAFGPSILHFTHVTTKQEADLRYCLIRTRESAESIAFFRGGQAEWVHFCNDFKVLLVSLYQRLWVQTGYHAWQRSFSMATFAVAPLMVGPRYLRGEVEFGTIAQTQMAFNTILHGFSIFMSKIESLSSFAVRIQRLHDLEVGVQREQYQTQQLNSGKAGYSHISIDELAKGSPTVLELADVTVQTPIRDRLAQQLLVQRLSLRVTSPQSLLIAGDSGIGKSSILRVIAGLWYDGAGRIHLCERSKIFFMPQKPYMCVGSLREQMLYPVLNRPFVDDATLVQALEAVNLGYLLKQHSLSDTKEWGNIFSLGEQQRINFTRVLLQEGLELVLLDEGTSACDSANEARLYKALAERLRSYVSVGHRPALQKFHSHVLWLQRGKSSNGAAAGSGSLHYVGASAPARSSFLPMAEFQQALAQEQALLI